MLESGLVSQEWLAGGRMKEYEQSECWMALINLGSVQQRPAERIPIDTARKKGDSTGRRCKSPGGEEDQTIQEAMVTKVSTGQI